MKQHLRELPKFRIIDCRTGGMRVMPVLFCLVLVGCGVIGHGGGGGKNKTDPVTGLTATAGNASVTLNWNAYPGATNYNVYRSTSSGIPDTISYLPVSPTTTTYTDVGLTNGTTYYYAVNADGSWGVSNFSNQVSVTPAGQSATVAVTVDILANAHVDVKTPTSGKCEKWDTICYDCQLQAAGLLLILCKKSGKSIDSCCECFVDGPSRRLNHFRCERGQAIWALRRAARCFCRI